MCDGAIYADPGRRSRCDPRVGVISSDVRPWPWPWPCMPRPCYPRRSRSAIGVDIVLTLDVCMFVCLYVC